MKLYIVRHGETNLNKQKVMQGLTDEPLNETGIAQAEEMKVKLADIHFDAVYASNLSRAVKTASIISGVPEDKIIKDERITEVCFGKYELRKYLRLGAPMTLHWLLPETFPAPKTVEKTEDVKARVKSFLADLKNENYGTVLIVSHGNLIRTMIHQLDNKPGQISWKDFVENCEIKIYEL